MDETRGKFVLKAPYQPSGDQPQAIEALTRGVNAGMKGQVLLGVTGSGKTFTMASVIAHVQRPTLVIAHNKTLAAQLCSEFRAFFPDSAVEYFVSYYDYYQPEAYIASSDTYIEKDAAINEEIDRLRHSATAALRERRDVIIVASVSCIYSMGDPSEYEGQMVSLRPGMAIGRDDLIRQLIAIQYDRNDVEFERGTFRVRGDVLEIIPAGGKEHGLRIEFFGDEIESISEFEVVSGHTLASLEHASVYPATHYATDQTNLPEKIAVIERDLKEQVDKFTKEGKLLEAERIAQRTNYDIEMMREIGYCSGVENYSRYFDGRKPGDPPFTLLDYFPKNFITFIDESHMTVPQIRAMYNGDRSRKQNLVDFGFRLKSAYDNRPLTFAEFDSRVGQTIFISATPAQYELSVSDNNAEQVIRPTGLLDPLVEVRSTKGQIDDLQSEINKTIAGKGRILVTTLTKRMAESLTDFLKEQSIKVRYMHSDVDTLERIDIIQELRRGDIDVLVGINLLREGLDLPEVKLVAILDADKEGFLRSDTALIQTIGRTARNAEGRVIMYADVITDSMRRAIDETARRRKIQQEYNEKHGIVPTTIIKKITNTLEISKKVDPANEIAAKDIPEEIEKLQAIMKIASKNLDFEKCIELRDTIAKLRQRLRASLK